MKTPKSIGTCLSIALVICGFKCYAQLAIDNSGNYNDPDYLVQNVLVSTGVSVSNITFNGLSGTLDTLNGKMIGYFDGDSSNIGMDEGILLSSGDVNNAAGPNDDEGGMFFNQPWGVPGDSDLIQLSGMSMLNAAKLEFDFETVNDTVSFRYVFASEEYPEYTCGTFNDAFGFFISGPGISGPYSNGAKNIALIPGTTTPVAINTVNMGTAGMWGDPANCTAIDSNWTNYSGYYVNNGDGTNPAMDSTVQYDGFTTVLTAEVVLIPCQTYHIKLVVADAMDESFDSGVFLEAGSFGAAVGTPFAYSVDSIQDASCSGSSDGSIYGTVTGGNPPYQFLWSNGSTSEDISGILAGTYFITVTDSVGCTFSDSVVVNEPTISLTLTSSNATCGNADGTASVSATGGALPYAYAWSDSASQATDTALGLSAGTYTVMVTDAIGCSVTGTVGISNTNAPVISTDTLINISCNGNNDGIISVSTTGGTPPLVFLWDDVSGQTTSTATGLEPGTYSVIVSDSVGCIAASVFTITEPGPLTVSAVVTDMSCNGLCDGNSTAIVSGGTMPYAYMWNDGQMTQTASNLCDGPYGITVTDNNGCIASDSSYVSNPLEMVLLMDSMNATCGDSSGYVTASVINGASPYAFLWSDPAQQTTDTASGLAAGSYTVVVTDMNGCNATDSITIINTGVPEVTVTTTDVSCNGLFDGSATASATGGSPPYIFVWSNGTFSNTITGIATGMFFISVTDSTTCTTVDTAIIYQPELLTISINVNDITCNGANDGSIDVTCYDGKMPYTFSWSNGSNTEDLSGLSSGSYMVTVTDSCGTMVSDSIVISEPVGLDASLTHTNISCYGANDGSASITATGGTPPYSYLWNNPAQSTIANVSGLNAGSYAVVVTDSCGSSYTDSMEVLEPSELVLSATVTPATPGNADGTITLSITGGNPPYTPNWGGVDLNALPEGNYGISATDSLGCMDSINVYVPDSTTTSIIPNSVIKQLAIGPNPTNNLVSVTGELDQATNITIEIMDLSGRKFFSHTDIAEKSKYERNIFLSDFVSVSYGFYLIKVIAGDEIVTKKLIYEK